MQVAVHAVRGRGREGEGVQVHVPGQDARPAKVAVRGVRASLEGRVPGPQWGGVVPEGR